MWQRVLLKPPKIFKERFSQLLPAKWREGGQVCMYCSRGTESEVLAFANLACVVRE